MKNVVIIMADQLRRDFLGKGFSPNIDELASESVNFERVYCASPLCVPARGALYTGRYPNNNGSLINPWRKSDYDAGFVRRGIPNMYSLLEDEFDSWNSGKQHFLTAERMHEDKDAKTKWINSEYDYPQMLKDKGIPSPGGPAFRLLVPEQQGGKYTHVKQYSSPHTGCWNHEFDDFFDGYFLSGALRAIRERDRAKPLLLNAMFLAPHPPLDIPKKWYDMYRFSDVPMAENVAKWYKKQSPLQIYNLSGAIGSSFTAQEYREAWRVYAGLVTLLDDCVGAIVNELKAQGIYDDTLILFTSDHGEMLGSHYCFQKMCMYEESAHVPMILKFPKADNIAHKTISSLVSHVDVLPTILSCLGKEIPQGMDGLNLMPLITGKQKAPDRGEIFIQFDGNGALGNFQRCCLSGDYKMIIDIFKDEIFAELYNVKDDPMETENLAFDEKYSGKLKEYIEKIRKFMIDTNDRLPIPTADAIIEALTHYDLND